MAPRVDPVQSDPSLPARADVVIVGGGIIGTSTALFLAQKGVSAVLCEKGHIAGEQSSRNWGWCRKMVRDRQRNWQHGNLVIDYCCHGSAFRGLLCRFVRGVTLHSSLAFAWAILQLRKFLRHRL